MPVTPSVKKPRIVEAAFIAATDHPDRIPAPVHVEIAFAGRSNVGKSSLMNAIMGRRNLVRTSSTPGCTRTICFFEIRTDPDARLVLVDLPGYGYAARSKGERNQWGQLIDAYLVTRPTLRAVVMLVDARRDVEDEERNLLRLLREPSRGGRPKPLVFGVATKLDQLSQAARAPRLKALTSQFGAPVLGVSVRDEKSVAVLWDRLIPIATQLMPPDPVV
jgi:GTP-binding protein